MPPKKLRAKQKDSKSAQLPPPPPEKPTVASPHASPVIVPTASFDHPHDFSAGHAQTSKVQNADAWGTRDDWGIGQNVEDNPGAWGTQTQDWGHQTQQQDDMNWHGGAGSLLQPPGVRPQLDTIDEQPSPTNGSSLRSRPYSENEYNDNASGWPTPGPARGGGYDLPPSSKPQSQTPTVAPSSGQSPPPNPSISLSEAADRAQQYHHGRQSPPRSQHAKSISASEAARRLEESKHIASGSQFDSATNIARNSAVPSMTQPANAPKPGLSSASAQAAAYESNRRRTPALSAPAATQGPTVNADGKRTIPWTADKPLFPGAKPPAKLPSDNSWTMSGGNTWTKSRRPSEKYVPPPESGYEQEKRKFRYDLSKHAARAQQDMYARFVVPQPDPRGAPAGHQCHHSQPAGGKPPKWQGWGKQQPSTVDEETEVDEDEPMHGGWGSVPHSQSGWRSGGGNPGTHARSAQGQRKAGRGWDAQGGDDWATGAWDADGGAVGWDVPGPGGSALWAAASGGAPKGGGKGGGVPGKAGSAAGAWNIGGGGKTNSAAGAWDANNGGWDANGGATWDANGGGDWGASGGWDNGGDPGAWDQPNGGDWGQGGDWDNGDEGWPDDFGQGHQQHGKRHSTPAGPSKTNVSSQERSQILNNLLAQQKKMADKGGVPGKADRGRRSSMPENWDAPRQSSTWSRPESDKWTDEDNRKVRFSGPEAWKSPQVVTTTLFPAEPNIMADLAKLPIIQSHGAAFEHVRNAFFGSSRLARDRIFWVFPPNQDERVAAVLDFIPKIEDMIGAYGLLRFCESRERGGIFINAAFRLKSQPKLPAFDWLTFDHLRSTMDKTLQESVAFYDPSVTAVVFVYLPSQSGNSVAIWRRKVKVPEAVRAQYREQLSAISKNLRNQKDYVCYVDEIPRKKKSGQLRKNQPQPAVLVKAGAKPALAPKPLQDKKKKKRWWQLFG